MISRSLVPMDDSEAAEQALEYALENYPTTEITVLHVVSVPTMMMGEAVSLTLEENLEDAAEERSAVVFERARELAADHDREIETTFALGHPARAILSRAENYDAIVLGSHGRHGTNGEDLVRRFLIGNVAETVSRRSPVPVTIVR